MACERELGEFLQKKILKESLPFCFFVRLHTVPVLFFWFVCGKAEQVDEEEIEGESAPIVEEGDSEVNETVDLTEEGEEIEAIEEELEEDLEVLVDDEKFFPCPLPPTPPHTFQRVCPSLVCMLLQGYQQYSLHLNPCPFSAVFSEKKGNNRAVR